ncbi:Tetratricopeptide repeat [Metalysinibacillus saudimassiliensis]|uniref:Tetratricopeptide repeat n=1 Tax=Metalysinibacillus saudimassiliensis TaxID=1461583 RepID=A0A078MBT4_9BACL|nr:Tetratricopeptide repeat [Metalysinibacillus saudimassiliensis]
MHKMNDYFYRGAMMKCFAEAQQIAATSTDADERTLAAKYLALFEEYEYDKYPKITHDLERQSIERADESYEDLDEVQFIRTHTDEADFKACIAQLEQRAKEGTANERAASFVVQGELFILAHHYPEAVHCFQQAIAANPNKGLYWGLTGQTMHRFGWMPFDALGFLEQAIQLDPKNSRWQWNQALVLIQLAKDLQEPAFLANAAVTLEDALTYCREEQASLKAAIQTTYDEMENYVFS